MYFTHIMHDLKQHGDRPLELQTAFGMCHKNVIDRMLNVYEKRITRNGFSTLADYESACYVHSLWTNYEQLDSTQVQRCPGPVYI